MLILKRETIKPVELLADSNRGIYIPQHFAQACSMTDWCVRAKDAAILEQGPEHDWYWDVWASVLDSAQFTSDIGVHKLHHDGDLWSLCWSAMSAEDRRNFEEIDF